MAERKDIYTVKYGNLTSNKVIVVQPNEPTPSDIWEASVKYGSTSSGIGQEYTFTEWYELIVKKNGVETTSIPSTARFSCSGSVTIYYWESGRTSTDPLNQTNLTYQEMDNYIYNSSLCTETEFPYEGGTITRGSSLRNFDIDITITNV